MTTHSSFGIKSVLKQSFATAKRLQTTASVAGLSALRVAKGEKPDALLLKQTFEQLGVTYIKLGQFIASTPSLFPKEYVVAFADCLDQTTPIDFLDVLQVLDTELSHLGGAHSVFASIDKKPLASASIAQVHKAVLKSGETVAIKVQKPQVATIIPTDLGVLHSVFWALEKFAPAFKMTNLAPIMHEIKARMMMETDFVAESLHLEKFRLFLAQTGNTSVVAPRVFDKFTTKKVLTMEFFEGKSLINKDTLAKLDNPQQIMANILDTWFLSLMMTGEFHADLHAGNLLLLNNQKIGFLDFGLVGKINPQSLQACFSLVQALQSNNYTQMAEAMADIGMTHDRHKLDVDKLARDLARLIGHNAHADVNLQAMMADLIETGKSHGIRFPRDFALLTKQLLYFDRFMLALAPEMDMFNQTRTDLLKSLGHGGTL